MNGMTIDHEGRVFRIDDQGMPKSRSGFTISLPSARHIIIMVNGFDYDPTETSEDNPHLTLFKEWNGHISAIQEEHWDCFGFGWYSAELEPGSWVGGLLRLHWNPYRWGWELAGKAGGILAKMIAARLAADDGAEICIVAHSMGARVALSALTQLPRSAVKRVLLLNGSEYSQTAKVVSLYTNSDVLNVVVKADDVLSKLGSIFAPEEFIENVVGQSGLCDPPHTWLDICLDNTGVKEKTRAGGYLDLCGDNPDSIGDHWYSYTHEPNWFLFRDFLSGTLAIDGLRNMINPPVAPQQVPSEANNVG